MCSEQTQQKITVLPDVTVDSLRMYIHVLFIIQYKYLDMCMQNISEKKKIFDGVWFSHHLNRAIYSMKTVL